MCSGQKAVPESTQTVRYAHALKNLNWRPGVATGGSGQTGSHDWILRSSHLHCKAGERCCWQAFIDQACGTMNAYAEGMEFACRVSRPG